MRIRFKAWARPELEASSFYRDNPEELKNNWIKEFKNQENPIHLELGCGKGQFIAQKAIQNPEINYIAIDLVDAMLGLAKRNVEEVFKENDLDAVIHCAAFKAVGESVEKPIEYYTNNLTTTLIVAKMMKKYHVNNIVFSSSATVYGDPEVVPLTEDCKLGETTNPYGASKAMMERILTDVQHACPEMSVTLLRYFNPIGAHESGLLGEDPKGIPNNLMPYIMKVAAGELPCLGVFGDDYDTPDGTGVRDYIHVVDLAKGHVKALKKFEEKPEVRIYNLGTGIGYSVLDVLHAYEEACGKTLPYEIKPRRAGDIATCYCDATKAKEELGWAAEKGIKEMCADSWKWQSMNPDGYRTED